VGMSVGGHRPSEPAAEKVLADKAKPVPGSPVLRPVAVPEQRHERSRPDRSYVRCQGAGATVVLAFPYDAAMVSQAKAIEGRRFDWTTKTNVYPFGRLPQVVEFADAHGIDVPAEVRALVPVAAQHVRRRSGVGRARETRDTAHLYLGHGLLPVPGWAVRDDGTCRCPRGTACPRPGKHPRSVYVGPGKYDYSWRPLTCSTHEEIEQRFVDGEKYAIANLMLAIPNGMLVIDQDFDDGGRLALAALADRFGELPATLSHSTPHGTHLIYRTPPGWITRAWVGKDDRNPVPAGIDLRVPGQILMAPPSQVPGTGGLASYGPVTGSSIADLPAAYLHAWTPSKELLVQLPPPTTSLPLGIAEVATSYVHARISGITEDLAVVKPGGRNTAIYTAALKVGSTLGAARSIPGAEQGAAEWTDQEAEDALMAAAGQNGYIADHSVGAARSAVRSGLRNGLRNPPRS
jgi:Bifunctional DNA primase/polymerase, N-terminal